MSPTIVPAMSSAELVVIEPVIFVSLVITVRATGPVGGVTLGGIWEE
jgi:hypothetical protein